MRHADFTTWQPPEEEGDDEPIWGDAPRPAAPSHRRPSADEAAVSFEGGEAPRPVGDVVELHVTVGRRDGARASDLVRILEKAGLPKDSVQRVRVRERHAFLTVRAEDEERAIATLSGALVAGRTITAERARERTPAAPTDAPSEPGGDEPAG